MRFIQAGRNFLKIEAMSEPRFTVLQFSTFFMYCTNMNCLRINGNLEWNIPCARKNSIHLLG